MSDMERLTMTSDKGGVAFTFDLDITCKPSEAQKILRLAEKLKHYEDLAEQGRLIELPCGIGADVYFVPSKTNFNLNVLQGRQAFNRVYHQRVHIINFNADGWYFETDLNREYGIDRLFIDKEYKEIWFLTEAEAEAKLKELEG